MDAEWWNREDVKLYSISPPTYGNSSNSWWERTRSQSLSAASNLLALNPCFICGYPEPVPLWVLREQCLSVKDDEDQTHPDLIIVTPTDVWIVEVKYPYSKTSIQDTKNEEIVDGLVGHRERIEKLGWWADRTKRLCVVWVYDDEAHDKHVADRQRIHINQALRSTGS